MAKVPARHGARARLGILGGTFDPPHHGHLVFAEWARSELALDRVLFVPSGTPPHKRAGGVSPAAHRLAMTRLAVRGNPAFRVSAIEVKRRGPSWTADTLRALAAEHPRARLYLLLGADMFATLASWREPEEIARLATIVVALRPGARTGGRSLWDRRGQGVVWLANPGLDVSSSLLRERARRGRSLRYLVPEPVARYVARRRLYARRRSPS